MGMVVSVEGSIMACRLCGENLHTPRAQYCVACMRRYTRYCPKCRHPDGRKRYHRKQRGEKWMCDVCFNAGVVFEPPEKPCTKSTNSG